jgi:hypothetical protein
MADPITAAASLIGSSIATAASSAGAAIAAHPFLFAGGLLSAGLGAYSSLSGGAASREAAGLTADRARFAADSESEKLKYLMAQNRLGYEAEATQSAVDGQQRQRQLRQLMATQIALGGSGNVDVNDINPILSDTYDQFQKEQSLDSLYSSIRRTGLNSEYANLGLDMGTTQVGAAYTTANAKIQGDSAYRQGLMKAGGSLLNFAIGVGQRGAVPGTVSTLSMSKARKLGDFDSDYSSYA